jgi:lysophospholipase L1-like esterase
LSRTSRRAIASLVIATACSMSCGDGPTQPSEPLAIACPAPQTATSPTGAPAMVTYPAPEVTGGTAPYSTSCQPASGSAFAVGATPVSCTTRDGGQRTASCAFSVTVTRAPQLQASRFMAFGDSITAGVIPEVCTGGAPPIRRPNCTTPPPVPTLTERLFDAQLLMSHVNETPFAYPLRLQALLTAQYPAQLVVMNNEGLGGRRAVDDLDRLRQALTTHMPQVLLLQEGINDLHGAQGQAIGPLVDALRSMIRDAKGRGIRVMLGTLLPEDACGCRGFDFADGVDDIAPANAQIRTLAAQESATLVDLYPVFVGQTETLLTFDGLHPNPAGYEKMAEKFFEVIRATLEQ